MVKMLVISDTIKQKENEWKKAAIILDTNIVKWHETHPRLSDYEIIVLDMKLLGISNQFIFTEKRDDIYKLLDAGGVVVCLTSKLQQTNAVIHYPDRVNRPETNYDWLTDGHQAYLEINTEVGAGTNIETITKSELILRYFQGVKEYHKTIESTFFNDAEKCFYTKMGTYDIFKVEILARNKVTKEPIACIIHYSKGRLVFLPQNSGVDKFGTAYSIVKNLYEIGKELYEKNKEEIGLPIEAPAWLDKYKSNQERELENKRREKETELETLKKEHKRFELIDLLLYGYDEPLVDATKKVFEEWGCEVEKTEKGATIDLRARHHALGIKFALEATGVTDKIYKTSPKFAQVLQYLPHQEDNEKIVVVVNTYRNKDISERDKENFTKDPIEIATNNKFCLITTVDLFNLWKDFLNGRSVEGILKSIFETNGEYKYTTFSKT